MSTKSELHTVLKGILHREEEESSREKNKSQKLKKEHISLEVWIKNKN